MKHRVHPRVNRLAWLAVALAVGGALIVAMVADRPVLTNADRVRQLAEDFACPVCAGQSLAESDVPVARTIKATIAQLVDDGVADDEVRSLLVTRFGTDIDYNPSGSGLTGVVWVLPVVAGVLAVGLLVLVVQRWQGSETGNRRPGLLIRMAGLAVLAVLAGLAIAGAAGSRRGDDAVSGDIRSSTRSLLIEASVAPLDEAIEIYDRVLELQPSNVEALAYRGWAVWRGGDAVSAQTDLDDALTLDPSYPDARVFRASRRLAEGDPVGAAEDLFALDGLDAPPIVGDLVSASRLRERVVDELARSGEVVIALELLDSGLSGLEELDSGRMAGSLLAHRGWLLATTGDPTLAELSLLSLDEAITLDPTEPYALAYRAVVLQGFGFGEASQRDAEAFAALSDQPPELLRLLVSRGLLPG